MSTGKTNTNSQSAKKNIRFEHDLIEAIESHKDELIPFAAWVKQACKEKLEREGVLVRTDTNSEPQVRESASQGAQVESPKNEHATGMKRTTREERIDLVRRCAEEMNLDYKDTSKWLNENGYLAERGPFTPNSVRAIKKRAGIK